MGTTPVVTATFPIVNAAPGQVFAASQLFSASDTGGDPILDYQVEDESTGASQRLPRVLNGAVLPSAQITEISAAQLPELSFVAGVAALDLLEVAASDSSGFGVFTPFSVAAASPSGPPPFITAANALEAPNLAIAAANLF